MAAANREKLQKISVHFLASNDGVRSFTNENENEGDDNHGGKEDEAGTRRRPAKRRREGRSTSRQQPGGDLTSSGPMSRLIKLREIDQLDACFAQYVGDHSLDAATFMDDKVALELGLDQLDKDHYFSDAFLVCYRYTTNVTTRTSVDHVRFLFMVMNMHAVVGLLNPRSSQHHLSDGMCDEVMKFLAATFQGHEGRLQEARDNVKLWNKLGKRLVSLCDAFGEGALFLLHRHLSVDL